MSTEWLEGKNLAEERATGKKKQDRLIGTTIADRYTILSVIGYGSTASVYKAEDAQQKRIVAFKILHAASMVSDVTIRRFEQERNTLALLKHPNIVTHYDSGMTDEDAPFFVMEYLEGHSLKQIIEEKGSIEIKDALPIFMQTCAGLAAAHEKGVVHRDMKPANIMVMKDEHDKMRVKILDFGVAKIFLQGETFQTKTQTSEMLGTLLYMSPEQCLDEDLDGRSDVYSLGCVLFESITGVPPLCGRTAFETMNKHMCQIPQKLSLVRPDLLIPEHLERIVQKACEKSPQQRYQNISAFEEDLGSLLLEITVKPNLIGHRASEQPAPVAAVVVPKMSAPAPPQTKISKPPSESDEDTSRQGAIHFLALESLDGVNWRSIYAETINSYVILDTEVIDEQRRLVARDHNLKEMEQYALEKFTGIDEDKDGFMTRQELNVALNKIDNPWGYEDHYMARRLRGAASEGTDSSWRDKEYITFLLQRLDDIRSAGDVQEQPDRLNSQAGISIADIKAYFKVFDVHES